MEEAGGGAGVRRAAVLLVRGQDAAGGLVLRLQRVRLDQRLLVTPGRDEGPRRGEPPGPFSIFAPDDRRVRPMTEGQGSGTGVHHVQLAMPRG